MFRIYPAVDIKDGRCVRLYQGDMARETVYSERPWEVALAWQERGVSYLHVIDLDAAAAGTPVNREAVGELLRRVAVPVQYGGGVRTREDVARMLAMGAERVILGTRALEEPSFASEMLQEFGPRVIVSVDSRGGEVASKAWRESAGRSLLEVVEHLAASGAQRIIHTDIARDGTLAGHDTAALEPLLDRGLLVIAAGGIGGIGDLERLKGLVDRGVEGAVVGRAIYTGDIDLREALRLEEE